MTAPSRWKAGTAAVAILAVATGSLVLRGGSTKVAVEDVVERYREQRPPTPAPAKRPAHRSTPTTSATRGAVPTSKPDAAAAAAPGTPAVRPLPPEGVYVYATTGGDEVDVFGGTRHTYPNETTITVRHIRCGLAERWDALEERWDERETCRSAAGDALHAYRSYHEFFGQGDTRRMRCDGFAYPAGVKPGDRWSSTCRAPDTEATSKLQVVGFETLKVAGTQVRTLHIRVVTSLTGSQTGSSQRDVWASTQKGLSVREHSVTTSHGREPVIGDVTYHEEVDLRLVSLEPRR